MDNFWKNRNVLVTGANGFIGSWVTRGLLDEGAIVSVLLRDIIPNSNFNISGMFKKVNIVKGSLVNFSVVERALNEYKIDSVFHLAAQAIVGVANRSPLSTFESNIRGTWNLLEACRQSKTFERVIVASSDKAYGDQKKLPYTEESPLLGIYPYDASKVCADVLSRSYHKTYGMSVGVTRCANIYGGGDINFNRIVPDMIQALIKDKPLVIRSDGTFERDYMYVKDAVNAYLIFGENVDRENIKGGAFNFGTGKPIKVIEFVNKIIEVSGIKGIKPKILGAAKAEILKQYLDSTKANKLLNWKPKYSLEHGLKETFDWYKNYFTKVDSK